MKICISIIVMISILIGAGNLWSQEINQLYNVKKPQIPDEYQSIEICRGWDENPGYLLHYVANQEKQLIEQGFEDVKIYYCPPKRLKDKWEIEDCYIAYIVFK